MRTLPTTPTDQAGERPAASRGRPGRAPGRLRTLAPFTAALADGATEFKCAPRIRKRRTASGCGADSATARWISSPAIIRPAVRR